MLQDDTFLGLGRQLAARLADAHAAFMAFAPTDSGTPLARADARARQRLFLRGFNAYLRGLHALHRLSLATGIDDFSAGRVKNPDFGARPSAPADRPPAASRCGAITRAGGVCERPAMPNGRCRAHGGLSTGPRTAAGRARIAAAQRRHGRFTAAARAERRRLRESVIALDRTTAAVRQAVYGGKTRILEQDPVATCPGGQG